MVYRFIYVNKLAGAGSEEVQIKYLQRELRASWMSQELLSTFNNGEISEIRLQPQYTAPGGDFEVRVNDRAVWDRRVDGGFPQPKELKRRVRDAISPDRDLGHNDRGEGGS